ncbi:uncharacterized protein LACBIDRAFT_334582 [Laccaria bicolor S238N-H82]|uniref:Predicted protein n=1 Tax=Laccaria bicolor (strain S238N-H82 / ATCC MYA-4686) TaxID=486041 RepID=B0DZK1_LACBS|nr:uncharacterized protein LACBIDRAFT_334582 [Laccaria bicolor S238N-H82]EDQ99990.1 predicted protein [Laccaria bicolor S238N-H82]|eukprot:XP_001889401.1 predicted protein [Laccaria bicolor S238N-H82]
MKQMIEPVPDMAQPFSPDPAQLFTGSKSQTTGRIIKPPSPSLKPQPRATKQTKKKSFKALEDVDSDYEYDNRDNDLSDLSDLELSSPAGRCMRKRGPCVSPPLTVTVKEPRAIRVQNPAVITALVIPSPQREVSTSPVVQKSLAVQKKAPDGPAKTCQKKCKQLVHSHYQCPVGQTFCVAWD